jgi:hypothetical protein
MVRCNLCNRNFPLIPGKIVEGKQTDRIGRRMAPVTTDHEFQLPSAAEEAAALVRLFESGNSDLEEIRDLIRVTDSERRCLEFLEEQGMLAAGNVARIIGFRERVLEEFNALVQLGV